MAHRIFEIRSVQEKYVNLYGSMHLNRRILVETYLGPSCFSRQTEKQMFNNLHYQCCLHSQLVLLFLWDRWVDAGGQDGLLERADSNTVWGQWVEGKRPSLMHTSRVFDNIHFILSKQRMLCMVVLSIKTSASSSISSKFSEGKF